MFANLFVLFVQKTVNIFAPLGSRIKKIMSFLGYNFRCFSFRIKGTFFVGVMKSLDCTSIFIEELVSRSQTTTSCSLFPSSSLIINILCIIDLLQLVSRKLFLLVLNTLLGKPQKKSLKIAKNGF